LAFSSAWLCQDRAPSRVAVLLELGASRGNLSLPLRGHSPHCDQVLARRPQSLVSLQERSLHLVHRGATFDCLRPLVQELIPHSLKTILQPPVIGPQGLHEGVEGVVLQLVPVAVRTQLSEAVVPLPSPALQFLLPTDETQGDAKSETRGCKRDRGASLEPDKNTYMENQPRGTPVDPHRLVQRIVERGVVVSEFLPQRLSAWASSKWAGGALACPCSCFGHATATSGAGRAARDDEALAPCVGCRGITQPSSRISSNPTVGLGVGAGQFSHWPHPGGGASSSGISTTGARSPAVGTGAGGTADAAVAAVVADAAVAAVVAAAAAAAFYRDPVATVVPRGGSLVATALPAAGGALDERRLVGTDASDLSTLVGVRAGTVGATLRTKKHKTKLQPLEIGGAWGERHLPQTGKAPLPLPRGFGRRHHGSCRRRRCAHRCPRGLLH
jgi:hypothetical protein